MFKVSGRVYVKETGEALPGLHVKAVDKDLFFDDVLGTAVTDKDGLYEITYEKKDFAGLFESAPDLYVVVRDAQYRRILYSGENSVRCDAGVEENIDIAIPKSELDTESNGPQIGKVKIQLTADASLPEEVKLFFTEHLSENRKQHMLIAGTGNEISVDLPAGEYTMQILARGYDTFRGLVEVDPLCPFAIDAFLKPKTTKPSTFEERLARYGIDASKTEIGELNVLPRTTQVLNYQTDSEKLGFQMLYADSIAKFKEWIGSDDAGFGHDRPVYGPLPDVGHIEYVHGNTKAVAAQIDPSLKFNPEVVKAVTAIAREYVYGNSKAVAQYEPLLNEAIRLTTREFMVKMIPFYFYRIVTIGAGATLEIGRGSAIFSCDELRIHKTGKLKPVDSVKIEIGTYTEFE